MPKVFISYKNEDEAVARRVKERVERHEGFETYFDRVDGADITDSPELAEYLQKQMDNCDQLIAVVSHRTVGSWWVPWEIGVGFEKDFKMASYLESTSLDLKRNLPSYLRIWPMLETEEDIDKYCKMSIQMTPTVMAYTSRKDSILENRQQAADFHRELKRELSRS